MRMLAFDIGGTAVKYGIFDGDTLSKGQFPVTDSNGKEDIPGSICRFVQNHSAEYIVISAPGPFDYESGTGKMTHKLSSLYGVSLRNLLVKYAPPQKIKFVHDLTPFAIGAIRLYPHCNNTAFVMLGTGFGYTYARKGKIRLNKAKSPLHPLWNMPYMDGIAEDYVSVRAIVSDCAKEGYSAESVYDAAVQCNANKSLENVFRRYGYHLGKCISIAQQKDRFENIIIGGQISKSWHIIKQGFESSTNIPYTVAHDQDMCTLYGLKECAIYPEDKYCTITEEDT